MSSVTRYEPEEVIHRDRYETATMYEKADGGYVEFDDYEALRLERDAMAIYRDQGWAQAEKLESESERLRKDAERYRWLRRPESGNALFTLTGSGECGPNMDSAIDSAMAAKDGA